MSNCPIDIETAKNTKLFKKFMESKNKSSISMTSGSASGPGLGPASGPRIENVNINIRSSFEEPNNKLVNNKNQFYAKGEEGLAVSAKFGNNESKANEDNFKMQRQQQTYKRNAEAYKFTNPNMRNQTYNPNDFDVNFNFNSSSSAAQPKRQQPSLSSLKQKNESLTSFQQPIAISITKPQLSQELPQKYTSLLQQHNGLKSQLALQRKQHKKQQIKLQQQIDLLNKKIFQLRNYEDQLLLENKRFKERGASQGREREKLEQNNRQLGYQIQQLRDLLNGQQSQSKKKQDQSGYLKKQNQDLRQKIRQLQMQILILKDQNNVIQRQKHVAGKQVNNKDMHINEMRDKISSLINQNGVLRDQMYHITAKLYHFEQENQVLKADLRRHSDDFPRVYLQEQLQSAKMSKPQHSYQDAIQNSGEKSRVETNAPQNQKGKSERRRGQFARERGLKKVQTFNNNSMLQQPQQQHQNYMQQKQIPNTQQQPTNQQPKNQNQNQNQNKNKEVSQAIRKLDQLNQQLQKLKDMKAMNGTMRRQKINLEREILELEEFVKSRQGN